MAELKPITIRKHRDGIGLQGHGVCWRAYGLTDDNREFALPDNRYSVLYPLDSSTESGLRKLCASQYPNHPIEKRSRP